MSFLYFSVSFFVYVLVSLPLDAVGLSEISDCGIF